MVAHTHLGACKAINTLNNAATPVVVSISTFPYNCSVNLPGRGIMVVLPIVV